MHRGRRRTPNPWTLKRRGSGAELAAHVPDFTVVVEEVLDAEGARVLSRVTYQGTHREAWEGIPATGRTFSALGLDLWRVEDERIVEHWHVTDHLELVFALGGRIAPPEP